MSEELKSNLQILAEYLGCEITEINPDKKITVADATMLMHLYSAQCKQALAKADEWVSVAEIKERISELNDMQLQASDDADFCVQLERSKSELKKLLSQPNQ